MISAMSTSVPLGTPCAHVEGGASPSARSTNVMISFTVTSALLSQSPAHGLAAKTLARTTSPPGMMS
jgi:hypothetical protein